MSGEWWEKGVVGFKIREEGRDRTYLLEMVSWSMNNITKFLKNIKM